MEATKSNPFPVSFSKLKSFQNVLDGVECPYNYYMKNVLKLDTEKSEAMLKGIHFEYLITGNLPQTSNEYEKNIIINGNLKKDGKPYAGWDDIFSKSEIFKSWCAKNNINFVCGRIYEIVIDNIRHKIITDVEAENLIIDLKFTSMLEKFSDRRMSWFVDDYRTPEMMLKDGYKIWQAEYYAIIFYLCTAKLVKFLFYISDSRSEKMNMYPYMLEFSMPYLERRWTFFQELSVKCMEYEKTTNFEAFVPVSSMCQGCNEVCSKRNMYNEIIKINL